MTRVNCFEPKPPPAPTSANYMDLRPTILGSVYKRNFRSLPTDMAELTWEASQAVLCVKGCAERLSLVAWFLCSFIIVWSACRCDWNHLRLW